MRIAARGDGVTASGKHVPMAVPGDVIDADNKLVAGPHRQEPPCRHFPRCGGCQLQHVDDAAYRRFLVDRIAGALSGQGLDVPMIRDPHLSPPRTRRRAVLKVQSLGRDVVLGFTEGRSHRIVDMKQCEVLHPALFALVAPLRQLMGKLLPRRGSGTVAMTLIDGGVDVVLSGVKAEGLDAHDALLGFASEHQLARLAIDSGEGPEDRWAPDPATVTLSGVPVGFPHGGFLQATADGEAALVASVGEAVAAAASVADLFSGLGTFSLALAERASVLAVEAGRAAILAQQLAANRHHRSVRCEHRDLYRRPLTVAELNAHQAVVLDPPRAGAEEQVRALAASAVPVLAYVSCNPVSFARDAAILVAGGYHIDWVQPVGQFRWSTHMELAARFSRQS